MGVITYVLLSGLSPFAGDDHSETFDNITELKYGFDDPEFQDVTEQAKEWIYLSSWSHLTAFSVQRTDLLKFDHIFKRIRTWQNLIPSLPNLTNEPS